MKRFAGFLLALLPVLPATSSVRADEVDDFIKAEMKKLRLPGLAVAVVKEGKIVKAEGYGLANVELNAAVTPDTVFPIASVSKQFVAAGIMLLVEDGKIDLDEKLSKYLKDTPETWKDITIRRLLTHTSGMARDDSLGMQNAPTETEYFKALAGMKLDSPTGTKWAYSNAGFNLLGMVIRQVSGKDWDVFMRERIFAPLEMTVTRRVSNKDVIPNRAAGYVRAGEKLRNAAVMDRDLAAGGIMSTVKDMAKWDAALYTDKPLSQASREKMWKSGTLGDGSPVKMRDGSYGFGWHLGTVRGHKVIDHGGIRPGYVLLHRPFRG